MHYNLSNAKSQVERTKSYQDYLDEDRGQVPAHFRELGNDPVDDVAITPERYSSRAFYERERAMWDKVWQATCRIEQIPEVGDYQIYEICQRSYLIVRVEKHIIKAYPNVCLHRGRLLRTKPGRAKSFTCPYHGFSWNLDGSNAHVPCEFEFPHIERERFGLPEVQVGIWAGWVFINPNPAAMPLEKYLDPIRDHYEPYLWDQSYLSVHVGKLLKVNWKIAQEAFMESFHALMTHPQIMGYFDDIGSQYDVWKGKPHVSRMLTVFGAPSPYVREQVSEQDVYADIAARIGKRLGIGDPEYRLQPGETARNVAAEAFRKLVERMTGADVSHASDAELLDGWYYSVFPNLMHWGGYGPNVWYRFRPWKDDHETTLMEVGMVARQRSDENLKPAASMVFLDLDQPWASVSTLGDLGPVLDQDSSNMAAVQQGLKASPFLKQVTTASYQECRIRHFHRTLDGYI